METIQLSVARERSCPDPARALAELREDVIARTGCRVCGGPFAGLKISRRSVGSELLPKLLGTYEMELHGVVEDFLSAEYDVLINIGCGEGYYAVGFAMRWKNRLARILACDLNPVALEITRHVAASNGTEEKLECFLRSRPEMFDLAKRSRVLVLCDVEGDERALLDPGAAPGLRQCDLLVEAHDWRGVPRIRAELERRFATTHRCHFIVATARTGNEIGNLLPGIPEALAAMALDENRAYCLGWMVMKLKRRAGDRAWIKLVCAENQPSCVLRGPSCCRRRHIPYALRSTVAPSGASKAM